MLKGYIHVKDWMSRYLRTFALFKLPTLLCVGNCISCCGELYKNEKYYLLFSFVWLFLTELCPKINKLRFCLKFENCTHSYHSNVDLFWYPFYTRVLSLPSENVDKRSVNNLGTLQRVTTGVYGG